MIRNGPTATSGSSAAANFGGSFHVSSHLHWAVSGCMLRLFFILAASGAGGAGAGTDAVGVVGVAVVVDDDIVAVAHAVAAVVAVVDGSGRFCRREGSID